MNLKLFVPRTFVLDAIVPDIPFWSILILGALVPSKHFVAIVPGMIDIDTKMKQN
jgi:hypothetical protein